MDGKTNGAMPAAACVVEKFDIKSSNRYEVSYSGLTKRELFAAMAMQGLLTNPGHTETPTVVLAAASVDVANALLAALSEPQA